MGYHEAVRVNPDQIPVIDITSLREGGDGREVAKALYTASRELGFIYIKGHGIAQKTIDDARDAAYRFFRASTADKDTVRVTAKHRGWLAYGGAKMQADVRPDLKESYIWGRQWARDELPDAHPLRGANIWPEFVPELRPRAVAYFEQVHEVAEQLMRGFALGLDLEADFFLKSSDRPLSRATFVYYPSGPQNAHGTQFGVGPHTDFGVLTVLCQDDVGGLEVEDINGNWVQAPPIEGSLVVNVGDLLSRWTDGMYKSTPHRVVNSSGRERLSLVMAYDPNPETKIDATQIFGPNYQARQEATTCGDYLVWRFKKAFSYRS